MTVKELVNVCENVSNDNPRMTFSYAKSVDDSMFSEVNEFELLTKQQGYGSSVTRISTIGSVIFKYQRAELCFQPDEIENSKALDFEVDSFEIRNSKFEIYISANNKFVTGLTFDIVITLSDLHSYSELIESIK